MVNKNDVKFTGPGLWITLIIPGSWIQVLSDLLSFFWGMAW